MQAQIAETRRKFECIKPGKKIRAIGCAASGSSPKLLSRAEGLSQDGLEKTRTTSGFSPNLLSDAESSRHESLKKTSATSGSRLKLLSRT